MDVVRVSRCSRWAPPSAHTQIVLPRYGVFYVMEEGLGDALGGIEVLPLACGLPGCDGCPEWVAFDPQRDHDVLVAHRQSDHLHVLNMDEGRLRTHAGLTRIGHDVDESFRAFWLEWHAPVLLVFTEVHCLALDTSFAPLWGVELDGALTMGLRYGGVRHRAVHFINPEPGAYAYALADGRQIDVADAESYADREFVLDGVRVAIYARRLVVGWPVDRPGAVRWKVALPSSARYEGAADGKLVFATGGDSPLLIDVRTGVAQRRSGAS